MTGNPVEKGRLTWLGKTTAALTFVHTSDLAAYLAAAVDAEVSDGERIDIGWDRPVSVRELANLMGDSAGKPIKVRAIPSVVTRGLGVLAGWFNPMVKDMPAIFGWFDTGRYVADTRRQAEAFGPAPTAEQAVARLTDELARASP